MQSKSKNMSSLQSLYEFVEANGIFVTRESNRFAAKGKDVSFPFIVMTLCLRGSARAMYDMRELTHKKNELVLIMPGHIMHPLECSEDYAYAQIAISQKIFEDLRAQLFSHDYEKFHYTPICSLTDIQAQRLLVILDQLALIASHTDIDFRLRNHILYAQLAVGYEYLNYYRREQDQQWAADSHATIFAQFCDLVVAHYKESKEIQYYADQLHRHPKYLSRVICSVTHGVTPREWIEQYVVTQAKRLILSHPNTSLKQVAFMLGFTEATSFYRYFKRVTGMTAKEWAKGV